MGPFLFSLSDNIYPQANKILINIWGLTSNFYKAFPQTSKMCFPQISPCFLTVLENFCEGEYNNSCPSKIKALLIDPPPIPLIKLLKYSQGVPTPYNLKGTFFLLIRINQACKNLILYVDTSSNDDCFLELIMSYLPYILRFVLGCANRVQKPY